MRSVPLTICLPCSPNSMRRRRRKPSKYAPDLNDAEIIEVGRDPFLTAHALAHRLDRNVVTVEASKPSTKRANRRIPDVCNDLEVRWCNSFQMLTELNFRTGWRSAP
ncbi:DUF4411 family protein (plasmid) [Rhizobium ruizarguesonis]|uniref:DUF4411 family protein n=1 Tax=Rhizobium ruizarguesonis TaxID=2081791 RepID=UPI0010314FBC|nr:DUF4411 family protein [Rhizobium ruizarguesonis]TAW06266.1 DUF4411 family protein [Rhizobium ruizarguesonis]